MSRTMPIDYVREVIIDTINKEHANNPTKYFGGSDQVNLFSFYEQLVEEDEVNRYTEYYRALVDQQNRSSLIMNGVVIAPENPQIMNVHAYEIVPMSFTCTFRLKPKDRDMAIDTINNMIKILKGRKRDIACLDNGKLFVVGTIANNVSRAPMCQSGDYIGSLASSSNVTTQVTAILTNLYTNCGVTNIEGTNGTYYYVEYSGKLMQVVYNATTQTWTLGDIDIDHSSFSKYKLSMSFDSLRIDEPYNLNGNEEIIISFGGSATLVDGTVELGNDLTKVGIKKDKIETQSTISLNGTMNWLEPLEMPNNLGIANEINQLASSNFLQGKQNTGINPTLSYSFVLDKQKALLYQFWKYARYGIQGQAEDDPTYSGGVTPNMIFVIYEFWSSWGNVEMITLNAKATENIEIENTESDVLTLKLNFEVQP